ncbi:autotransporter domain-containing protein [Moraxella sp. ZJ142]|uniref:autotransporter domain-containing protein n=1 Tax=Moraxella marmotae TaxID=3344520 RepID=UPI0035D47868
MKTLGKLIKLSPLAIACAIALPAHAESFSQTVFFGDSLTDTGRLSEQINSLPPLSLPRLLIGQAQPSFTTNPDDPWSKILAKSYGHTATAFDGDIAHTNYAVGGARVSTLENSFGIERTPVTKQIDEYFAQTNNKADPNALYSVWIGANDLIAAGKMSNQAAALALIQKSAKEQAEQIQRLQQAGANYILVPSLPDVGITPEKVHNPKESATATTAAKLYNQTLYQTLNASDANVIAANTFALLQEAVQDKANFGFVNVDKAACTNASLVSVSLSCQPKDWQKTAENANETYAFADGIHPSGRTHRILAQYYQSIIDSPAQVATLPTHLISDGKYANTQLHRRLARLDNHEQSIWVDVAGSDNNRPNTIVGLDIAQPNYRTGAYVQHQKQSHRLGTHTDSQSKQTGVGVYHSHDFNQLNLTANVGIDRLDIQTDRQIVWDGAARSHQADGTGRRTYASLQGSYGIGVGKVTYRPYLGVSTQTVKVKTLIENQPKLSTAMRFDSQKQKSTQGEIGLNLAANISDKAELFGGVGYQHEFNDDPRQITAGITSLDGYTRGFSLPVANDKQHRSIAHLGAKFDFGKAQLTAGVDATHSDGDTDVGGFIGVQSRF